MYCVGWKSALDLLENNDNDRFGYAVHRYEVNPGYKEFGRGDMRKKGESSSTSRQYKYLKTKISPESKNSTHLPVSRQKTDKEMQQRPRKKIGDKQKKMT